jgi:Cu/Ag efflux protein CusF
MSKIQQARYAFMMLWVVAMMCTSLLAHEPGVSTMGAMDADKHHTQGQKHEMQTMDHKPMQMEMASEGIFEGTGEVIALVPDKGQIVVKHQEIVGFMAAMTMGYAVEPTSLLDGLQPGDVVNFKIDAAKKKIIAIETIP